MSELKDPAIKLFGKTISLPQNEVDSSSIDDVDRLLLLHHHHHHHHHRRRRDNQSSATTTTASQDDKNTSEGELTGNKQEDDSTNLTAEESTEPTTVSGTSDENKTSGVENETISPNRSKKEEQDDSLSQEKTLKKPDKIIPCPRCNSMDTKFCYYNNYNVNQPRHFCKNCQRYWTAGGTMRNVPVGSGRRKNKNSSCANYRHIMISDALQAARVDVANGIHIPSLKANGTVLTFGSERPLCESISTALNLAEVPHNHFPNGFHGPEQKINIPSGGIDIAKDNSNGTSSITTCSTEIGGSTESVVKNCPGYLPHVSPFPGPPWPCPWNAPQWRTPLPAPAFSPPGFPVSFYPAPAYWGCAPPGPWNMPWPSRAPSSSDNSALSSAPTSPTLGKHSRDGNILSPKNLAKENPSEDKNKERCILIPKTLRIDDPNEAAKSSIWSTLGIQKEKADPISRTSLFKAFPSKHDEKNHIVDTSLVLQANPAAYSRSQNFQESM